MKIIISATENIFQKTAKTILAMKKIFSAIQIIFGTIWTPVRAEQKVISVSPTTFCLRTCGRRAVVFPGAKLQLPFALAEYVDLTKKWTIYCPVWKEF
jgi:hypothetical protein